MNGLIDKIDNIQEVVSHSTHKSDGKVFFLSLDHRLNEVKSIFIVVIDFFFVSVTKR
jgi:hypothetical protein